MSSKIVKGVNMPDFALQTCQFRFGNKMVFLTFSTLQYFWTPYYRPFAI